MAIADNSSCVQSRRWLRAIEIERVVVASQKLGADGWIEGCRCRRSLKRMDVGPEAGLREATGYSDSANSDQCVGRRRVGVGGGDNG